MTPAKILFPNEVAFTGSRETWVVVECGGGGRGVFNPENKAVTILEVSNWQQTSEMAVIATSVFAIVWFITITSVWPSVSFTGEEDWGLKVALWTNNITGPRTQVLSLQSNAFPRSSATSHTGSIRLDAMLFMFQYVNSVFSIRLDNLTTHF